MHKRRNAGSKKDNRESSLTREKKRGFNLIAPVYDFFAGVAFFGSLWRAQSHFVSSLAPVKKTLIFGGGTGRILVELIQNSVSCEYTYVDISEKMLSRAKKRLWELSKTRKSMPKVEFICGTQEDIPKGKFNTIVTPFILDCFNEADLAHTMRQLNDRLLPNGAWLFTDFYIAEGSIGYLTRFVTRTLYLFFNLIGALRVAQLPNFSNAFSAVGLIPQKEKYFLRKMLVTRVYCKSLDA